MAVKQGDELMDHVPNLGRIMHTAMIWFSVAFLADALVLGLLTSSGWRPTLLPAGLAVIWWVGAVLNVLSLGLLAWSGCPILEVSVPVADRNKSRTMQAGTLLIIVSSALCLFAVLVGPVS